MLQTSPTLGCSGAGWSAACQSGLGRPVLRSKGCLGGCRPPSTTCSSACSQELVRQAAKHSRTQLPGPPACWPHSSWFC